jgi:hypothetical protein
MEYLAVRGLLDDPRGGLVHVLGGRMIPLDVVTESFNHLRHVGFSAKSALLGNIPTQGTLEMVRSGQSKR